MPVSYVIENIGYCFLVFSASGIVLAFRRRRKAPIHSIAMILIATLISLPILCEYGWPVIHGSTILTPTRFPTDMAAFLARLCGIGRLRHSAAVSLSGMILFVHDAAGLADGMECVENPQRRVWRIAGFPRRLRWVKANSPPTASLSSAARRSTRWTTKKAGSPI